MKCGTVVARCRPAGGVPVAIARPGKCFGMLVGRGGTGGTLLLVPPLGCDGNGRLIDRAERKLSDGLRKRGLLQSSSQHRSARLGWMATHCLNPMPLPSPLVSRALVCRIHVCPNQSARVAHLSGSRRMQRSRQRS